MSSKTSGHGEARSTSTSNSVYDAKPSGGLEPATPSLPSRAEAASTGLRWLVLKRHRVWNEASGPDENGWCLTAA